MYAKLGIKKGSAVRVIKAKNIESGMTIEWLSEGLTKKGVVKRISLFPENGIVNIEVDEGYVHFLGYSSYVVVLEEPKDIQPPEPTALGARVMVSGMKLVRTNNKKFPWHYFDDDSFGITWNGLCGMGQVIIVEADPWWPTEESDEGWSNVPQYIEGQWPEDDEHLREYKWRDNVGWIWHRVGDNWIARDPGDTTTRITLDNKPSIGPWHRVVE